VSPSFASVILSESQQLKLAQFLDYNRWTLCYRGTTHGFSASTFHTNCNGKPYTITIAYASNTGRVFGGYVEVPWRSIDQYSGSMASFVWRFNGDTNIETAPVKPHWGYQENSMYDTSSYCPTFGGGHDLHIDSGCRNGYTSPNSYVYGTDFYDSSWLAGCYSCWYLAEIEVWYRLF